MEETCWRLLETIQQLVPLLQGQPPRLQYLPKGLSSYISSQSEHFWSSAFGWIWNHIFSDKSCTYRNQSNYKDPFRSFTWEQPVHKIDVRLSCGFPFSVNINNNVSYPMNLNNIKSIYFSCLALLIIVYPSKIDGSIARVGCSSKKSVWRAVVG